MRRRPLLASVPLALSIAGALLLPGTAWAGSHCRKRARHVSHVAYSCRHVVYRPAVRYVAVRSYSRSVRPVYCSYDYRECERPRYSRYYYDDWRECDRPRYYTSYRREYSRYCDDDYYVRRYRQRRPSVEVFVNLSAVFGGGHRHWR